MANEPNHPQNVKTGDALRDRLAGEGVDVPSPNDSHLDTRELVGDGLLGRQVALFGPDLKEMAIFCRMFATLIEVGTPVLKAVKMLARRSGHQKLRLALKDTARGIEQGQTIHQSMMPHIGVFGPLVVNIIRIGELGGILETSLRRLADIMESKARIRRQVRAALYYPVFALIVAVIVISVIMIFAIPKFKTIYDDMPNAEMPGITLNLIALSSFMANYWYILLIVAIVLGFGCKAWVQTPGGNYFFSWLALRIPRLRKISQEVCTARFCRTLSSLVNAGIPLVDALAISADTNENGVARVELMRVHEQVESGERIGESMERTTVFPEMVVDMVSVAEETGTLDRTLDKLADHYDAETQANLAGIASVIEPILILVLGGVVMFIFLAVLLPYFNLVSALDSLAVA